MYRYIFHGVRVTGDFDLGIPEPCPNEATAQKHLTFKAKTPLSNNLGPPFWESPFSCDQRVPHARFFGAPDDPYLEIPTVGIFHLSDETVSVHAEPDAPVIPFLLGRVFAIWRQKQSQSLHRPTATHWICNGKEGSCEKQNSECE